MANPIHAEVVPRELGYVLQSSLDVQTGWYVEAGGVPGARRNVGAATAGRREAVGGRTGAGWWCGRCRACGRARGAFPTRVRRGRLYAALMPRSRSLRRRNSSTTTSRQTDSSTSSVATARIVGLICSRMPENIAHGIVRCS